MSPSWPVIPGVPAAGHVTTRGFWHPGREDGCVKCWEGRAPEGVRAIVVKKSDVDRCPKRSLAPSHYAPDGTCGCRPGGGVR